MDSPHIKQPFRIIGHAVQMVEEDSPIEIAQAAQTVLMFEIGERDDLPEFGVDPQVFRMGGVELDAFRAALEDWEPRYRGSLTKEGIDLIEIKEPGDA